MSSLVPEFPPIPATNPTVTQVVPSATYDQWFIYHIAINAEPDETFSLETFWRIGNATATGTVTTNFAVRDLLGQESLIANPEIAEIAPQFMAALAAVGKRLGVL